MYWGQDPFFDMMGQRPRYARQPRQPRQTQRRGYGEEDVMTDFFGFPVHRKPSRRSQPMRQQPVRPARRGPTIEEATNAAETIQSAFRMHRVKKHKVAENLKALAESESRVKDSLNRFHAKLGNPNRTAEQTRMVYATVAEELTKEMLRMDQITTYNEPLVRQTRKSLVKQIQKLLSQVDAELPQLEALAREELEKRMEEAQLRAAEEEALRQIDLSDESDESDYMEEDDDDDILDSDDEDLDDEDLEDEDEQVEGEPSHVIRTREIMAELESLQTECNSLESKRRDILRALAQCESEKKQNQVRQLQLRRELRNSGLGDGMETE